MTTAGVDFFRVDRSGSMRRWLVIAGVLVLIGATLIGAHAVNRLGPDVAHLVSLIGAVSVVGGLVLGFGAMAMLVFENVYLLIQEDGMLCHDNGKETKIAWADLESVTVEGTTGFVVFKRADGSDIRWFAGKSAPDVRARVEEAKRKALHGLLKTDGR